MGVSLQKNIQLTAPGPPFHSYLGWLLMNIYMVSQLLPKPPPSLESILPLKH